MATGDVTFFEQFFEDESRKVHNLETDTIKVALISNVTPPTAADAAPHFGGTGTTNHATNQVTGGTSYTAGGEDIAATAGLSAGNLVFDGTDVTWTQDGSGPTNIRWGIIYNDTDTNKRCIAFVQMGTADVSLQTGQVSITWNASGIGSKGQA